MSGMNPVNAGRPDAIESLTDLFLGEAANAATSRPVEDGVAEWDRGGVDAGQGDPEVTSAPAGLSVLLVGNLPVFSEAWVGQAAAAMAREQGATALVRWSGDTAILDVFPGSGGRGSASGVEAIVRGSPPGSLREARRRLRGRIDHWVVQARGVGEIDAWSGMSVSRVVLLSGADDAAVVAAYTTLKELQSTGLSAEARVEFIIVADTEDEARGAFGRMVEAGKRHLGRRLRLAAVLKRIEPMIVRPWGRFAMDGPASSWIANQLEDRAAMKDGEEHLEPEPVVAASNGTRTPRSAGRIEPRIYRPAPAARGEDQSHHAERFSRGGPVRAAASASVTEPVTGPAMSRAQPNQAGVEHERSWVRFVPGLRAMAVKPPVAPRVQPAIDAHGAIHLLVEDDAADDSAPRDLAVAGAWVAENAEVLVLIEPRLDVASCRRPTLHLFTDRPRVWRYVADGWVRLHLLVSLDRAMPDGEAAGRCVHVDLG